MKIAILTSVETRHRHFVRALGDRFNVVAVGYERIGYSPARVSTTDLSAAEQRIVADHYRERTRQEEVFFGANGAFVESCDACAVAHLEPGTLNAGSTVQFLADAKPDVVLVYGTNLLRAALIDCYPGRLINLHLGLSPYYRGTATNFYPLLNEEPQYVGATIHLIDSGIDSGAIFRHARPKIVADDQPHTVGCKALVAGIDAMVSVVGDLENGNAQAVPQWKTETSRLYLRKDFHPRQVVELHRKMRSGLLARYVEHADALSSKVRLVPESVGEGMAGISHG